ncbi:unnamed protein product [Cylicocyclus nassatus]|uniref:Uncharacterized protein n=1 Tax=Cylicocyclus nassatus TaxID=53992 RepID=A0AA36H8M3_CYLNA|nr:unnamed protein product [Cylicocyclus nassatus]
MYIFSSRTTKSGLFAGFFQKIYNYILQIFGFSKSRKDTRTEVKEDRMETVKILAHPPRPIILTVCSLASLISTAQLGSSLGNECLRRNLRFF